MTMGVLRNCLLALLLLNAHAAVADVLVFGSFRSQSNAENWARRLAATFGSEIIVHRILQSETTWYRVQSSEVSGEPLERLAAQASTAGVRYWRITAKQEVQTSRVDPPGDAPRLAPPTRVSNVAVASIDTGSLDADGFEPIDSSYQTLEWDFSLETRLFSDHGIMGQDRYQASLAIAPEFYRAWDDDRQSFTLAPFLRIDSADDERTHGDIREMFYTRVGEDWDLHIGAKRVFWGVTEFHHLIDIVNQTDVLENIDGEDKLGQPMLQLSLVRDWGILDLYALTGFRPREYPSLDGRFNVPIRVADRETYESGREDERVDLAARWSHHMGPLELGIHHFSGTSREPLFDVTLDAGGTPRLIPHYPIIEQWGVDAQAIHGDWAVKLEGLYRSGFGTSYHAFNVGLERTLVGILGTSANLGVVLEYMYDERKRDAFNTLFERDVALGGRLQMNDFSNTQALLGLIVDTENEDYAVSLEASRELSPTWLLVVEGRLFGGGEKLNTANLINAITHPDFKGAWLKQDDYLQIEIKKFL